MFDKLKQLNQIRQLKNELEKESREVEKEGVKVKVNGKMEVLEITLNPELDSLRQGQIIKECINEAMKQIQKAAAEMMFKMQ
ncbi:MAG: hypothetical protein A2365_01915 [Candidatus Nealsonbacteria bacterium RIFOXYB1_FULL_40_15]|uniref:Nucleoid-associated protein, YbaB/EbfC family n=1 Tax=Candidatus Nealsonbacteria bacterium RIFOXYB1_FULL_40_15 TaxID=1801677 RepID=A0A1G2EP81_9BACT|nr:MAG: hypothetical protein A2365_01915 [Candidatus Nealsonbacteria bacterium RIFOXYB1_FULL_40_15]OGZ29352.1 MAG: hypothetical protein A2562_01185 [Candidatus Nealsonbacteria bacterium RIFOXYD1_FULL_39_11]